MTRTGTKRLRAVWNGAGDDQRQSSAGADGLARGPGVRDVQGLGFVHSDTTGTIMLAYPVILRSSLAYDSLFVRYVYYRYCLGSPCSIEGSASTVYLRPQARPWSWPRPTYFFTTTLWWPSGTRSAGTVLGATALPTLPYLMHYQSSQPRQKSLGEY